MKLEIRVLYNKLEKKLQNMTYCSGKCRNFKAQKPSRIGRYASGQKRCNYCEIFVDFDGISCPCCNRQLRCLPRSRKGKERYLEQIIS